MTRLSSHTPLPTSPTTSHFGSPQIGVRLRTLRPSVKNKLPMARIQFFGGRAASLLLFSARHDVLKRRGELLLEFGVRHRLAR